ncbi:protein BANP-like isoform X2 [Dermacentor silvarum]|uniref:protein BANP-like isoform X2 n=1 Tax=Dermacentor silvarum TaxID=543639 RepID=UPI0021010E99|nr:protein BANP-like isoform X2 [Dermacentor silvarum]
MLTRTPGRPCGLRYLWEAARLLLLLFVCVGARCPRLHCGQNWLSMRMADDIPSFQLTVNGDSLPGLVLVDQMTEQADSPPLRLVPVGGGQFLLAKMAGLAPDEENSLAVSTTTQDDLATQLAELQAEVLQRLEGISSKLSAVETRYTTLGDKIHSLTAMLRTPTPAASSASTPSSDTRTTVPVCVPSPAGGTVEDYPSGSWLGNPADPDMRVRVPVSPEDLEMLNRTCTTPEKMALTLLDFLFDREVQASSNISGTGRHGKRQLDPLRIFAIKCHLVHQFSISDHDWHRIKQNMDSKCRTAFRRKNRGMSLSVKAFRDRGVYPTTGSNSSQSAEDPAEQLALLSEDALRDIASLQPQIIRTEHGDIQVVQATAEQLAQMERDPQIHILASTEVLSAADIEQNETEEDLEP